MPECLYCPADPSSSLGVAHVFPEALVESDLTLPLRVVCDSCNNYFGNTLDPVVVAWPTIALAIQFLELPGKTGKPRRRIAGFERPQPGILQVEVPTVTITENAGYRSAHVALPTPKELDIFKFRRALHHIALNLVAKDVSPTFARRAHFDPVRRYVRAPRKQEAWPFVAVTEPFDSFRNAVQGRRVAEGPGETVCLRIFNHDFYVDLLNRGRLLPWAELTFGDRLEIYMPHWKPPTAPKAGPVRHRIRLERE
jgi:hypothetical protein